MGKIVFVFIACFLSGPAMHAQKIEKYYDSDRRPSSPENARFHSVVEKTDSGWLRRDYFVSQPKLQMQGLYKDSACKYAIGQFYYFHANGILEMQGKYENNKKQGVWVEFYPNAYMRDSAVYDYGEVAGTSMKWHSNGYPSDSVIHNADGTAIAYEWFDNGSISAAGRLNILNQPNGKWQFFHRNGHLSALETYDNGKLVEKKYYKETGEEMSDLTDRAHPAEFPGGVQKWMEYLQKKLYFPPGYTIVNGDRVAMVVEFTVDENGSISEVDIPVPFHEVLDDVIRKVLKNAPKWNPAMHHNRNVVYRHKQLMAFNVR